jgi:molybdopterin synthase sulfur carrier subunit
MLHEVEIRFSSHLKRFIDLPETHLATGETVRDIVDALESSFPGVSGYLLHENGKLRQHVNLFLDDRMVSDREGLSDTLENTKTIYVMQALSGG